jgi:hypothetical protein
VSPRRSHRFTLPLVVAWSCLATYAEGPGDGDPTGEDPLDRPTLPVAMAVTLACVVLLAWAFAPFGWRGH